MAPVLFITPRNLFPRERRIPGRGSNVEPLLVGRWFRDPPTFLSLRGLEYAQTNAQCCDRKYARSKGGTSKREKDSRSRSSGRISRGSSAFVPLKGGFILRRFTMLYGVGFAASTNNCQLNVPSIDPSRTGLLRNEYSRLSFLACAFCCFAVLRGSRVSLFSWENLCHCEMGFFEVVDEVLIS